MKRRKRRPTLPPPGPSPEAPARIRTSRWSPWHVGLGIALLAGLIVLGRSLTRPRAPRALPAPRASTAPGAGPVFADFVGAESCAPCHTAEYDAWKGSTHGHAGGPPDRDRVIAPFDRRPMRFRDAVVTPSVTESGAYIFTVVQRNQPVRIFRVDAVVGGGFMAGGGTQALFSRFTDGTLRFLPFDYSQSEHVWFCNTLGRADRGWVPITQALALADCGDWPPFRILGSSERFQGCQQCHGSQIQVASDTTGRYETRFTTLAINCESCHGPGRRHVELARAGSLGREAGVDIGIRPLSTLTKDQSLEVCFQCHAAKTALQPGYLPGKPLQEHYAMKLPLLLDTIYLPDGRTRSFAYQEGHLSSDCYLNGSMSCVDCHDPHSQRYRDVDGAPLEGRFDNAQCLDCHPSKAEPLERHTHHRATSPGSRCVSCHMPYLQQPNVGPRVRYARSDHTIAIPRPLYDSRLGVEDACRQCHRGGTVQELEARVVAWYGELKPQPSAVEALRAADSVSDAAGAAETILAASDRHPMAEFIGLTQVLQHYAGPDMPPLQRETVARLEQRAANPDPDVQALALATLHLTRGADPKVHRFLARQLRTLGPRDGVIRNRWAWILRVRGDEYVRSGDYQSALATFRKAQELKPDDPSVLRSLGIAYTRLRDYASAAAQFRQSLALDPGEPQVLVELGFALMQQGDLDGAIAVHRQAIAAGPWDPAGYANLGVALLQSGAVRPGIEALEKALELNPGLAEVHFTLAGGYARLGEPQRAAAELERGLEFDPRNKAARRMLEALRR